ncbi:MAG: rhodanese-like domain-containing protein [Gammaproteobacteria bacterium]|jgi:rhodanese-related sulfurtransferase|nr:rhodanese-like domain-containing protein [Gammaproteobacteria bacterium]
MSEPRSTSSWRQSVAIRALLVCAMAATVGLAVTPGAGAAANDQHAAQPAASRLPDGKQTTLRLYVTSREAYEKWKAAPDEVTVLDVRTPEEYVFIGHAEMAWNIPLAAQSYQWDAEKKQLPMRPLPDFVARARKVTEPEDTILVMCRSGGRSAMAVNLLAKAGFRNVYNITDGMEGDEVKDPDSVFNGQRLVNGWKNSGLPWTYKIDPERMVLPEQR